MYDLSLNVYTEIMKNFQVELNATSINMAASTTNNI